MKLFASARTLGKRKVRLERCLLNLYPGLSSGTCFERGRLIQITNYPNYVSKKQC